MNELRKAAEMALEALKLIDEAMPFPVANYPRPQAREPLTDEEIDDIWNHYCDEMGYASINDSYEIARAIEAAHGITKGNT